MVRSSTPLAVVAVTSTVSVTATLPAIGAMMAAKEMMIVEMKEEEDKKDKVKGFPLSK